MDPPLHRGYRDILNPPLSPQVVKPCEPWFRELARDWIGRLEGKDFGGLHTTGAVMAGALVWLAGHPEDRARLRAEPGLMTAATEEFIRYVTPVPHMNRATPKDTVLGGCPILAGERVMFGLGSANHDETVFDDPHDVVLDRFPNRHFGFGAGPHRCVGSHLGKLGARIGLEEFLAAFRDFEVTDYYALRWNGGEGRGLLTVPMAVRRA